MMIRKPEIMIFDDSLSAVDAKTDAAIRKGLKKSVKDSTVFIVSHRITTIMNADVIYVFEQGKVVEMGTHEQLINEKGIYSNIFDLQRRAQEDE